LTYEPSAVGWAGAAIVLCFVFEWGSRQIVQKGPFMPFNEYLRARERGTDTSKLPDLPVTEEFQKLFRDWAAREVNFLRPAA
jgi:hypothetical protein